ncbi:MAG: SDR family NAD(P)-dependent oxidoreductase [Streptosporangiaceae bacterium]|jgi:NAD(P)-dependent dehydrogenase (short-subunit alcohol dehydrogenase family)
MSTTIEGQAILVTGANRGIGQALVTEALRRGAARVYAGTRRPYAHPDPRVTVLPMDITDEGQVRAAAARAGSLDILVNNAGVFLFDDLSDREALERHLSVNLFGTYGVIQAFLPSLIASGGAIVNNVSIAALAPIPATPAYSLSKAAAFSLTQSLRMLLAAEGVRVHAVLTGPTDTDMVRDLDIPKASPQSVAQGIFDGIDRGEEDIFPDPLSATLADGWQAGPAKALERQNAALLRPQPFAA